MEVFKFLKSIYKGENAAENHIILFSLAGIMVILFCCYGASLGNLIFPSVFIASSESKFVLAAELFVALLIFIYLTGYSFYLCNSNFQNNQVEMPKFNLTPFLCFIKLFPLFFIWILYYVIFLAGGLIVFLNADQIILTYIYGAVFICLIPFILLMFINFSKDLKYRKKFFNPLIVLKYINIALGDVIYLSIKVGILFLLISCAIFYLSNILISSEVLKLAVWLLCACIWMYFVLVFKYIYYAGLIKILNKYPDIEG